MTGQRVEKKVDGYSTEGPSTALGTPARARPRVLLAQDSSGDGVLGEYDGNNNLLRKYIYGPGMDQPVSMIEVADSNAVYYYHVDALGSVVALSDSAGDTVQTYEYSVYDEVAVEDANHANPYMFAGVRYDIEIGLYYNRARYYNPFTGRFLQTDPIGYKAGMNLYAYCMNRPVRFKDPRGLDIEPCTICGDPAGQCRIVLALTSDSNWLWATGRVMVLDAYFTPASLSAVKNLSTYVTAVKLAIMWNDAYGLSMDLANGNWFNFAKRALDPCSYMVGKYLDFMEAVTDAIFKMGKDKATGVFRAYIEVQGYKWKRNKDGTYVKDSNGVRVMEKLGAPYWVEVVGFPGFNGLGYEKREQALDAAAKASMFWECAQRGHSFPEAWFTGTWGYVPPGYTGCYYWKGQDPGTFGLTG